MLRFYIPYVFSGEWGPCSHFYPTSCPSRSVVQLRFILSPDILSKFYLIHSRGSLPAQSIRGFIRCTTSAPEWTWLSYACRPTGPPPRHRLLPTYGPGASRDRDSTALPPVQNNHHGPPSAQAQP